MDACQLFNGMWNVSGTAILPISVNLHVNCCPPRMVTIFFTWRHSKSDGIGYGPSSLFFKIECHVSTIQEMFVWKIGPDFKISWFVFGITFQKDILKMVKIVIKRDFKPYRDW